MVQNPLKNISQLGLLFPKQMEKKVPNHQPDYMYIYIHIYKHIYIYIKISFAPFFAIFLPRSRLHTFGGTVSTASAEPGGASGAWCAGSAAACRWRWSCLGVVLSYSTILYNINYYIYTILWYYIVYYIILYYGTILYINFR